MRTTLFGSIALVTLNIMGSAIAADLPVKAKPLARAIYGWNGFYVGVHAGGAKLRGGAQSFTDPGNTAFESCNDCGTSWDATPGSDASTGGIVGVHGGWNFQVMPSWLIGVEIDYTSARLSDHRSSALNSTDTGVPFVVAGSNAQLNTDIKWLASVRGRVGFTWNSFLAYFTGGVAWTDVDHVGLMSCGPPECLGVGASARSSSSRTGGVIGGGVEFQPRETRWRGRIEYLYYQFNGNDTLSDVNVITVVDGGAGNIVPCHTGATSCPVHWNFGDLSVQTLRAGLSYAFSP